MLGGAGAEVAATSSLDVGLLGLSAEALAASAADVGLDVSSLDDGREWSWDCGPVEPGRDWTADINNQSFRRERSSYVAIVEQT